MSSDFSIAYSIAKRYFQNELTWCSVSMCQKNPIKTDKARNKCPTIYILANKIKKSLYQPKMLVHSSQNLHATLHSCFTESLVFKNM